MVHCLKARLHLQFCCRDFKCDFLLLMEVNELGKCSDKGIHACILGSFITRLLVYKHQKLKIATSEDSFNYTPVSPLSTQLILK